MPKSKHGKGRYQPRKKKIIQPAAATQMPAEPGQMATVAAMKSAPARTGAKAGAPVVQYPYVMNDLIRVAVVSGIVIVVMIILAIILS